MAKTKNTGKDVAKKGRKEKKDKSETKRPPSAYNRFMKEKLDIFKKDPKNEGVEHKEAFKAVAAMWKTAPENPRAIKA